MFLFISRAGRFHPTGPFNNAPGRECYNKDENYQSLEILQDDLQENLSHSILKNICLSLDDEDEFRLLENTFFKI